MMAAVAAVSVATEEPEPDEGKAAAAASAAPSSWPPAVAARYQLPVQVGQGMFGKVYAAWDSVREQLVAVKQLSGRTDDEVVATGPAEFAQEVAALLACRGHPNVVHLLSAFPAADPADDSSGAAGTRFIVTEFAGPTNLRRYVQLRHRQGRPFREGEVRDAMAQLLSAVACAHDAGVLHREVVPENVVVDDQQDLPHMENEKTAKKQQNKTTTACKCKYTLCGFNASEHADATAQDGTAALAAPSPYRAPELFMGSDQYDGRVDTWALGCVMAELVFGGGAPFFGAGSDEQVFTGMLRVVGASGLVEWAGMERLVPPQRAAELRELYGNDNGILREVFSKSVLSRAGFDVLSGLLQSNPDRRLTAEAALRMPWFRRRGRGVLATCLGASS